MARDNFVEGHDFSHVLILLLIALVIGTYLIATTVLISKDGVIYIQNARDFSSMPVDIIKGIAFPFGYPFLIFVAHEFVMLFGDGSTVFTWIYTAQSVTLMCRIITLILLYFIGKSFVGGRRSFWAVLILIVLPYPAEFGSDVLRDWPHIMFLAAGFLLLLAGAKKTKYWMFAPAGLLSGFGHMIRPECAQLVIYGIFWIGLRLLFPKIEMSRKKLLFALLILLIGFSIPIVPYVVVRGNVLPEKVGQLFSSSASENSDDIRIPNTTSDKKVYAASALPVELLKAAGRLFEELSDNLMYYFMLPLVIGFYWHFRRKSEITDIERFFMPAFVFFNVVMLLLLYYDWGYISRRHSLPLVVFLVLYIPEGLEIMARWFEEKFHRGRVQTGRPSQRSFFILLVIGVIICMPKLLKPLGADKPGYKAAANWLRENTGAEDAIAVPDLRISFYAEREGVKYVTEVPDEGIDYLVRIVESGQGEKDSDGVGREKYSVGVDDRKKGKKKLMIYQMM
jgi:4-amino-4-deoxy-L-arabinose transferase-like glycosyltransferase